MAGAAPILCFNHLKSCLVWMRYLLLCMLIAVTACRTLLSAHQHPVLPVLLPTNFVCCLWMLQVEPCADASTTAPHPYANNSGNTMQHQHRAGLEASCVHQCPPSPLLLLLWQQHQPKYQPSSPQRLPASVPCQHIAAAASLPPTHTHPPTQQQDCAV
jgi:hypothetical protein